MKFIRDIVDSQQRLRDKDTCEAGTAPSEMPLDPVVSDHMLDLGQPTNVPPDPFLTDFYAATEELPNAGNENDDDTASRLQIEFGEEQRRIDNPVSAEVDLSARQSAEAPPTTPTDSTPTSPSGEFSEKSHEESALHRSKMKANTPTAKFPNSPRPEKPNEIPLPLRDRSSAQETAKPSPYALHNSSAERQTVSQDNDVGDHFVKVPTPEVGRASNRGGRAKTRLLGFHPATAGTDPMARLENRNTLETTQFPVGWLVITSGPGRGTQFTIEAGVAQIGRAEGQTIRLDFGDTSISRENHAAIAYDSEQNAFFIGHGGKANLVRRNDRPVLSTEELVAGDRIRVGETTLRFVPLCGTDFSWDEPQQPSRNNAVRG